MNNNNQPENFNSEFSPYGQTTLPKSESKYDNLTSSKANEQLSHFNDFNLRDNSTNFRSSIREQLDRLRLLNDNDLGISQNNFHSIAFKPRKDEELNLLN